MKPTIGRIVHYQDRIYGTAAAIITDVKDDGTVCLGIFHKVPGNIKDSVVYVIAEYSETPQDGYWSWPPRV